jgi:hypothetical protein
MHEQRSSLVVIVFSGQITFYQGTPLSDITGILDIHPAALTDRHCV